MREHRPSSDGQHPACGMPVASQDSLLVAIMSVSQEPRNDASVDRPALKPALIDLQINGLHGIDFNASNLSDEDWDRALRALSNDGTRGFLPTLITDSVDALERKLSRLSRLCEQSAYGVQPLGIHLEGPFLSTLTGFIGAHPVQHARSADLDVMKRLLDASRGRIRWVTLAPEQDAGAQVTRYLSDAGISVAAGHTDATLDQLKQAVDAGLGFFTHLGNACPMQLHRHDNILHRALALHQHLRYTVIADGYHLPLWLVQSWIEQLGIERVAIISDAISAAGLPPGIYTLGDREVWVGEDGVPRSPDGSHFVGSGATLGAMFSKLLETSSLGIEDLDVLFCRNARAWLGLERG